MFTVNKVKNHYRTLTYNLYLTIIMFAVTKAKWFVSPYQHEKKSDMQIRLDYTSNSKINVEKWMLKFIQWFRYHSHMVYKLIMWFRFYSHMVFKPIMWFLYHSHMVYKIIMWFWYHSHMVLNPLCDFDIIHKWCLKPLCDFDIIHTRCCCALGQGRHTFFPKWRQNKDFLFPSN